MSSCKHSTLVLLPEKKDLLRCRRCHLKIRADELGQRHCPECYEIDGGKQYDFEEIPAEDTGNARYRCEQCGVIVESK